MSKFIHGTKRWGGGGGVVGVGVLLLLLQQGPNGWQSECIKWEIFFVQKQF
jgi:hypothetical protein